MEARKETGTDKDVIPRVGQKVRFLHVGRETWRHGTVSIIWEYDDVVCVDVDEGELTGTFFPSFGDKWEGLECGDDII